MKVKLMDTWYILCFINKIKSYFDIILYLHSFVL